MNKRLDGLESTITEAWGLGAAMDCHDCRSDRFTRAAGGTLEMLGRGELACEGAPWPFCSTRGVFRESPGVPHGNSSVAFPSA